MMTPRSDAAPAAFKAPEPVAKKEKKKRDWKPRAPKEPREDPLAGYRDRAAERRAGDDQEAPDIASLTAEVLASRAEDPEKAKADLELEREIAKHTDHGAIASAAAAAAGRKKKTALDYSVLAQIRAEIEQEQEAKEKEEKELAAAARKKEKEQKTTTQGPQTELGRIVARALTEKKTRAEVISPYRKVLQYSLSVDAGHDMPVVTVLNKDDVHIEPACVGASDRRVGISVAKVMSYLPRKDHGDKAAKKKEKEKLKSIIEPTLRLIPLVLPTKAAPPVAVDSADVEMNGSHDETNDDKAAPITSTTNPPAAPQPIEEDDIFPSVGEYMPDLKRKESADKDVAKANTGVSYFGATQKLTGLEGLKLEGPKIHLKKGALTEEDLAAAEAEQEEADMEVDQGAGMKAKASNDEEFIASETFVKKPGYVFKMGPQGLGLYRDVAGPAAAPSTAAPLPAAAMVPAPGPAMPSEEMLDYPEADAYPDTDAQFRAPAPKQPTALELAAQGHAVVAEKPITPKEAAKKGLVTVFRRDDEALRARRETDKRERDPTFVSDTYTECYPGSFETTIEVYDAESGEEDDSKMDHGTSLAARRVLLKRWDFNTEEEWAAYNAKREANPKAAYQFGVKVTDGRKTRKDKDKDKPKKKKDYDAKINNELQQVNMLMKKRASEGKYEPAKRSKMPELD